MDIEKSEPVFIEALELFLHEGIELELSGVLESEAAQRELLRWLTDIDTNIRQRALDSFQVDVRKLEFVNSSAIRLFVDWISRAEEGGYKLVFSIDRGVTWQRLSFPVLESIAPEFVQIVDGAKSTPSGNPLRLK
ncbi:MAG TPA: hypothetical protein VGP93_03345 [Polyangiaceae bacterium]|nr:hypothetical protein [Polyangiaceae bacterium]